MMSGHTHTDAWLVVVVLLVVVVFFSFCFFFTIPSSSSSSFPVVLDIQCPVTFRSFLSAKGDLRIRSRFRRRSPVSSLPPTPPPPPRLRNNISISIRYCSFSEKRERREIGLRVIPLFFFCIETNTTDTFFLKILVVLLGNNNKP